MKNIHLVLIRDTFTEYSTVGKLYLNGEFECFTLEDKDRHLEAYPDRKVYGETCIPRGLYKVVLSHSNRFRRILPEVLYVHNFKGIRIHSGNSSRDTEGCILVGKTTEADFVGRSRDAFAALFAKLSDDREEVQIVLEVK
jgi:hypothetical protein